MDRTLPPLPRLAWVGIAVIALAYAYLYAFRTFNGPFRFNDDVAQHYLWLFGEFYDTPWQNGFYAKASAALQPWGYYALLKTVGQFVDPLTISRYGVFGLALLIVGYGTALFRRFLPITLAVASALVLFHYSLDLCLGFLARGFMIPLLLIFGYYLVRGHAQGSAISLLAAALFYPPALIINLTILGFFKAGELLVWWRGRRMQGTDESKEKHASPLRDWPWYVGGAALSLLLIWLHSLGVKSAPELGNFLPRETLQSAPEFSASGRVAVTNVMNTGLDFFVCYFSDRYLPSGFAPYFARVMLVLATGFGFFHYRKLGRLGAWALALTVATLILFLFARTVFPLLFLPDRFIVYPWRLLTVLVLTLTAGGIYYLLPRAWLATLLVVLLLGYAHYNREPKGFGFVGLDSDDKKEFYDVLRSLPQDALIAGPPEVSSWFPVMTQQMPFLSNETAHALYFEHYNAYIMPRFADYADAISTPGQDLSPVIAFMDKWDIDYFLFNLKHLQQRRHDLWSPHKQVFEARKDALAPGEGFALEAIPDSIGTWIRKEHRLLSRAELDTIRRTNSQLQLGSSDE